MNIPTLLLLLLVAQHALYGAAWWVGAMVLRLPRMAALHWMGYCLLLASSLLLHALDLGMSEGLMVALRNVGMLLACMSVRRGLALFLQRDPRDMEQMGVLIGYLLIAAAIGPQMEQLVARHALMGCALAWVLCRMGAEQVAALRDEFGVRAAWVLVLPPIALGLGLAARGLHGWWFDVHVGLRLTDDSQGNEMLLLTVLALSTLFQFSLLYLVTFRLLKKLHRLSQQDSLTGLLNRRAWDKALGTERQRLRRRPGPLALLVIDVDHFKRINDVHGHAAGDAALVAVGRALQDVARATDVVARLGGEEFGILLLDTDVPGATAAAERVRHEVSQLQVPHGLEMISFTVSVGAAVQPATESDSLRLDELQACADAALYRAKAEGRNRVVIEHFGQQPRLRMA